MSWTFNGQSCSGQTTAILYEVSVTDDHDTQAQLSVVLSWQGSTLSGSTKMGIRGPVFYAQLGPFASGSNGAPGDTLSITITATDSGGKPSTLAGRQVTVAPCIVIG